MSGVDLIRKRQVAVHALAWPLLTAADGTKLGKTTGARLWLDPAKTSPYQFHQHWMQLGRPGGRAAVHVLLPAPAPGDHRAARRARHGTPAATGAQRALADEVTALVHGGRGGRAAGEAADLLFGGDPPRGVGPRHWPPGRRGAVEPAGPTALEDVVDLLARPALTSSKSDARRQLEQGRCGLNGVVVGDDDMRRCQLLHDRYLLCSEGQAVVPPGRDLPDEVDGPGPVDSVSIRPQDRFAGLSRRGTNAERTPPVGAVRARASAP